MYHEHAGASLKASRERERMRELHHLRIYATRDASHEHPRWLVEHFADEEGEPFDQHEFTDGADLLAHIIDHASVPVRDVDRRMEKEHSVKEDFV